MKLLHSHHTKVQVFVAALLAVLATLLVQKPALASDDISDIASRIVTVQKDYGEVTHVAFFFFPKRFDDIPSSHFYPKMTKAFLDYLNHTLGQGKYIWVKVGYRETDCRAENWSKLAQNIEGGESYSSTPSELHSEAHNHNLNSNENKTRPFLSISFCRKLRTFRKGELEHDFAFGHTIGQALNTRGPYSAEAASSSLFPLIYADRKDVQLLPIRGPNGDWRLGSNWGQARNYARYNDKFYSSEFKTKESYEWSYTLRAVERTADGDPSKPYYWKSSAPLNPKPVESPKPPVVTPTVSSPIVLTGKPDIGKIWAEKLKVMWAEAAQRDAELAGRVAEENARMNRYKNDLNAQMDELTRNFCKTAAAANDCACDRPGTKRKICPR